MKARGVICLILLIIIPSQNLKAQNLNEVCYASEDTVFAAGWAAYSLYKSTDAGETWFPLNYAQGVDILALEFISPLHGFIAISATILSTTDGGYQWESTSTGTPYAVLDISFYDQITAYAVGTVGKIVKSIDGGGNWSQLNSGTDLALRDISILNENTAIAVGGDLSGNTALILRTTDGGASWQPENSPVQKQLTTVSFPDSNNGFAVGYGSTIIKSTDGGITWILLNSNTSTHLSSCCFVDAANGFIVGDMGMILKTTDGGTNWMQLNSNTNKNLHSITMLNGSTGIVVGAEVILKTTDGGISWVPKLGVTGLSDEKEMRVKDFYLLQNYPNPFNPVTIIQYAVGSKQFVTLKVYDVLGKEVATLVNEEKPAGNYTISFNGGALPSGIYFYQLNAGSFSSTKKCLLLK